MQSVEEWTGMMQDLLDLYETADYNPGGVMAPGAGREGDDPMGIKYADYGPLAFVLNESVDAITNTGVDLDQLLESIAQSAGEDVTVEDIEDVLDDKVTCPSMEILRAFGDACAIDVGILIDAAQRGGCAYPGTPSYPPGF